MNICSNFYPHTIIFCSNKDWGEQKSFYRKTSSQTRPHVGNTLNWRKNAVFCHYSFLPSISSSSLLCNYGFWVCYKRDFFLCGQDVFLISPSCRSEQWSISEEDTTDNESLCKTPAQCYQLLSCKSSIKIMPIFTFLFSGFGKITQNVGFWDEIAIFQSWWHWFFSQSEVRIYSPTTNRLKGIY